MASYEYIENTPLNIDPVVDFANTGWSVSNGIAYHDGCNSGKIRLDMDLSLHETWNFTFNILDMTSGSIRLYVDDEAGPEFTSTGEKTVQFNNSSANAKIEFYSDGKNALSYLHTYPETGVSNGRTMVFNEDENRFGGDHSYQPEFYHKFLDKLFSFKDGNLWEHDVNPIKNNFYGVQYTAKIKAVANSKSNSHKRFILLKVDSNKKWGFRTIEIPSNETYPNGMKSLLHENNFTVDKGEYWASFLRDMNDPQFDNVAQAIFEGRELEGKLMVFEMECKEKTDTELKAVYIYSTEKFRNF